MGLRFRKSVKIAPGVRLNFGKKSTSVSFGGKGARYTVSSTGRQTASVGIPGTGLSYVETVGGKKTGKDTSDMPTMKTKKVKQDKPKKPFFKKVWFWIIAVGVLFSAVTGGGSNSAEDTTPQVQTEESVSGQRDQAVQQQVTKAPAATTEEEPIVEEETEVAEPVTEEESEVSEPVVEEPVAEPEPNKEETPVVTPPAVVEPQPEQTEQAVEMSYVVNTNTMKFHYGSCGSVKDIKDHNRMDYTGSRDALIAQGYAPCGRCHP